MGKFNSDDQYRYYCGQESIRRNGVALMVNKESEMQYLGAVSKMTEWSQFFSKANHSTSVVREMQIKTSIKYHYMSIRMTKIKIEATANAGEHIQR